ncbi:hypothetical protein TruAng_003934 [Truncatella angustata]|nr:hypothetical protein TruAng_003934 [Truncatella angustata]
MLLLSSDIACTSSSRAYILIRHADYPLSPNKHKWCIGNLLFDGRDKLNVSKKPDWMSENRVADEVRIRMENGDEENGIKSDDRQDRPDSSSVPTAVHKHAQVLRGATFAQAKKEEFKVSTEHVQTLYSSFSQPGH